MNPAILALNIGSSSIKFAMFSTRTLDPIERGAITGIGQHARVTFGQGSGTSGPGATMPPDVDNETALVWLLHNMRHRRASTRIVGIGHRVVHGGPRFGQPVRVNDGILAELDALVPLAPAHQPAALAAIRTASTLLADVPQIACFDTAFHRTQPRRSRWFALPREMSEAGVVRYGFHGLSYEYIAGALPEIAGTHAYGRVVVAHLGHGASLCAMHELHSISTSMGFTTLDGLMMGTRSGSIDPGVLLYLLRERQYSVEKLADLLGSRSGLLGVSGISADIRVLESSDDPRADDALEMFADRAAAAIAAQCAALGGLDALVFTGGIGEHSSTMRSRICGRLQWLGAGLDVDANQRHARRISRTDAAIPVYVIPTDEEIVMARAVRHLIDGGNDAELRDEPATPGTGP